MNEILSYFIGKAADHMPSFLLSRFFPSAKVAKQVRVSLRADHPICLSLEAENPGIDIWVEITNLSHLKLVLDRLIVEVWFGQPTFQGAILKRYSLPPREIIKCINYRHALTMGQKKQIESYLSSQELQGSIYLYLTAYFESKVGMIETITTIERSKTE